ncbi:hypothetical protein [Actinomadura kijaniata]|uniref:hypothetical protein n=1 Tax=Actinomadura kijaniata TaxID=46161 RepID=UPI000830FB50|nr:hypothetical protein [Actinomadura kijaniata]
MSPRRRPTSVPRDLSTRCERASRWITGTAMAMAVMGMVLLTPLMATTTPPPTKPLKATARSDDHATVRTGRSAPAYGHRVTGLLALMRIDDWFAGVRLAYRGLP